MAGNTIGQLFRVTTFGESHGIALGCIVDGVPPNMALSEADIQPDLDRRKPGTSRYTTPRREDDEVQILSGVFEGKTTGTSIGMIIKNADQRSHDYGDIKIVFVRGTQILPINKNTAFVIIGEAVVLLLVRQPCELPPEPLPKNICVNNLVSKYVVF